MTRGADGLVQVAFGDRLGWHLVAQIGDDRLADEKLERQLMDLRAAAHIVLGRVDVTAGMQAHMDAAHDLAGTARRVVLLEHLHGELHVLGEFGRRAHAEIFRIELKTDVDDLAAGYGHAAPFPGLAEP